MIPVAMETGGLKCHHVYEISDSVKEDRRMNEGTDLALLTTIPYKGEQRKVKKKKLRKG